MRFTKTVCLAAATAGLAFSAAPALAGDGGPKYVWDDRPTCDRGYRAVWVDRPASIGKAVIDERTGEITFVGGESAKRGWECQPIKLVVIGP